MQHCNTIKQLSSSDHAPVTKVPSSMFSLVRHRMQHVTNPSLFTEHGEGFGVGSNEIVINLCLLGSTLVL